MTDDDLKKIRALADGATPGPWRPTASRTGIYSAANDEWVCTVNRITPALDVEFMAAARAAVPQLLDEVARLRESVECLEIARADVARQLAEMTDARDEACGELEDTGGAFAIACATELRKVGSRP